MTLILDGTKARAALLKRLKEKRARVNERPTLAIVQLGEREESSAYIARKKKFGEEIGVKVLHVQLPESTTETEILSRLALFNADSSVHGVILQLPLPAHLNKQRLLDAIALGKDVDGLATGSTFTPATARGVLSLLQFYHIPIRGKKVAVLGRSALVGAPTAKALREAGAIVMVCHSDTKNTKEITRASDIVVVAIGKPRFIGADYFRSDQTQTVVDVGITSLADEGLVGDVDFDAVKESVAAISPVPGGVGPMTVAALFENLLSVSI